MGAVKEARLGRMDGHPETPERQQQTRSISTFQKGHRPTYSGVSCVTTVSMVSEDRNRISGEPFKTFLSGLFLAAGFIATTTSLAFTHERVPETEPLPDLLLDHVKHQEWGLDVSEVLLMLNTFAAVLVVMLHSHRTIIVRRIWLILGLLYFYRATTMCVTVLPKSNMNYTC